MMPDNLAVRFSRRDRYTVRGFSRLDRETARDVFLLIKIACDWRPRDESRITRANEKIDECAINEYGIPGILLMENAAAAVAAQARAMMAAAPASALR